MPNWCGNTLTLTHEDPAMITRAVEAFAEGRLLAEFIPIPTALRNTTSPNRDNAEELRAQCGYSDWYDFCTNEWGTKWDVGDGQGIQSHDPCELIVYFDSAWSPPIQAYDSLVNQGFSVYATYYEPGCGFAGIYDDMGDNCYDLSCMSADEAHDTLPPELDDAFGISDSMYDMEAENEEELTSWYKDGVEEKGLEPHTIDPKLK
jgi:hypothetical protein